MSNISELKAKEIREAKESISHIDLSNLGLNDNDMVELQELLQNKPHITSLNLSNNFITAEGCKLLKLLTHIHSVNFSHNHLGDAGIEHLVTTSINNLDVSHNGLSDKGAHILIEHLNKYTELSISGNPNISPESADKIRSRFVQNASSSSHPIGIDLGLNIFSSLPTNFFGNADEQSSFEKKPPAAYPIPTSKISPEQALANKLYEMHATEILKLSPPEKEELIRHFCKSIGVDVQISPNAPTQKV
jgi:Leucine-rich repeat (LRR) protein